MADNLLSSSLLFSLQLLLPFGVAMAGAGIVASAIRTAFQLDEKSVNLVFKVGVLVLACSMIASSSYSELLRFTERIWSDHEYYN
jgi:type III secretory pathway component EscS